MPHSSLSRAPRDLFSPPGRCRSEDITRHPTLDGEPLWDHVQTPCGQAGAPAPVIATRSTPLRQAHTSHKAAAMEPSVPPPDPSVDLEAWVIYTRLAQGLPARVEDLAVLAQIADLICTQQDVDRQGEDANEG